VVAGVVPDGPGDRGGLQEGDLIVSLNSEEVASRRDLYTRLWRHEPGERLILEVMRENKVRRVEVLGGDRAYFFRQLWLLSVQGRGAVSRFIEADGFLLSAGLAFFFLVCLIPILILGGSIMGFVLSTGQASRHIVE